DLQSGNLSLRRGEFSRLRRLRARSRSQEVGHRSSARLFDNVKNPCGTLTKLDFGPQMAHEYIVHSSNQRAFRPRTAGVDQNSVDQIFSFGIRGSRFSNATEFDLKVCLSSEVSRQEEAIG